MPKSAEVRYEPFTHGREFGAGNSRTVANERESPPKALGGRSVAVVGRPSTKSVHERRVQPPDRSPLPSRRRCQGPTDFSDPSLPALEAAVSEAPGAGVHNSSSFTSSSVGVFALAAGQGAPFLPAAPTISLPAIDDLMNAAQGRLGEALARFAIDGEAIVRSGPRGTDDRRPRRLIGR